MIILLKMQALENKKMTLPPEQLKRIKNKQASTLASIDQLDSWLGEHIEEVIDVIEGNSSEDLVDKYGMLESTLMVYAYSILVTKSTDDIVNKLENNITLE